MVSAIKVADYVSRGAPMEGAFVKGGLTACNKRVIKSSQMLLRESYSQSIKIVIPDALIRAIDTFESKVLHPIWNRVNASKVHNMDHGLMSFEELTSEKVSRKPPFRVGLHYLRQLVQTKVEHADQRAIVASYGFNPLIMRVKGQNLSNPQKIQSLLVRLTSFIPPHKRVELVPNRYKESFLQFGMMRLTNVNLALRRAIAGIVQLFPRLSAWARHNNCDLSTSSEGDDSF